MKAAVIDGFGGPEVLRIGELPDPDTGPGEVRVAQAHTTVEAGTGRGQIVLLVESADTSRQEQRA